MLYLNKNLNPRSPLAAIRNQIKFNLRSSSRSASPSCSPIPGSTKNLKDYFSYVPIRCLSKNENLKPKSVTAKHNEISLKRKELKNESKKLEAAVREIKKKVKTESKFGRVSVRKKERGAGGIFKWVEGLANRKNSAGFLALKESCDEGLGKKCGLKKINEKMLGGDREECSDREMENDEIARRHYKLQVFLKCLESWKEQVIIQRMGSIDRSNVEEIDLLLSSFIEESYSLEAKKRRKI